MKKSIVAVALAVAALPVLGFASLAFADSPGQLSNSPDNYKVRNVTQNGAYAKSASATCNETVKYSFLFANSDFGLLSNLIVKANMDTGAINATATNVNGEASTVNGTATVNVSKGSLVYESATTVRITSDGNTRTPVNDGITAGGVNVGNLNGSTQIFVQFEAKVKCDIPPEPKPESLTCDALSVGILNNKTREVEAKVTGSATNTTIDGYKIDFGDGTTVNEQTAKHTYGDYGKYTIKGYVSGKVDGKTVTVGGVNGCIKTVEFKKPPVVNQSISCDALKVSILNKDKREVEAKVTGSATNTIIDGYKIDFGDGTTVNEQTAKHTYGDYGKYTIVAHVSGKVDGKTETVTSAACKKTVEFKKPPTPEIQSIICDALDLDLFNKDKRYVKVSVDATAQNTKIDTYEISFGDGSSPVMEQTAEHTYGDYGTYKIVAAVSGQVDGETVTDTNVNCEQTVEFKAPEEPETPPTTPETPELPNTGAGALVGLFSGASILGAVGHRVWTVRRLQ